MENRKLYLNNWEFNIVRVLNRLEKVITDNDGYFVSYYKDTFDNLDYGYLCARLDEISELF